MSNSQHRSTGESMRRADTPDSLVAALRRKSNDHDDRVRKLEADVAELQARVRSLQPRVADPGRRGDATVTVVVDAESDSRDD
jgi:uncharacterized protein YlxW (UPF0749 family)